VEEASGTTFSPSGSICIPYAITVGSSDGIGDVRGDRLGESGFLVATFAVELEGDEGEEVMVEWDGLTML
jgi:hypothetical protein